MSMYNVKTTYPYVIVFGSSVCVYGVLTNAVVGS